MDTPIVVNPELQERLVKIVLVFAAIGAVSTTIAISDRIRARRNTKTK